MIKCDKILNPKEDLVGVKFGSLTVIGCAEKRGRRTYWSVVCDCGKKQEIRNDRLLSAKNPQRSCHSCSMTIHGHNKAKRPTSEYMAWHAMRTRCMDEKSDYYSFYGARGITICDRWLIGEGGISAFECFIADMGRKPSPKHSIDRVENSGNYEPGNCRWATKREQARNTRANRIVVVDGRKMALVEACEALGLNPALIRQRIHRGKTFEQAASMPTRIYNRLDQSSIN